MAREAGRGAFNAPPDTGRLAFRYEWEAIDDRPLLVHRESFWMSPEEEALWVRAVRACPVADYGALDLYEYLGEIGKVVSGLRVGAPLPL